MVEVLSQAAARYTTPDPTVVNGPRTLQLLLDAGADLDRARAIWVQRQAKRRIQIGDAVL